MDADRLDAFSRSLSAVGSRRLALTGVLAGALALVGGLAMAATKHNAVGNAPALNIGSDSSYRAQTGRIEEDASATDSEPTENIQRINRELIEYGMRRGLQLRGYENLVNASPPQAWDDPRLIARLITERGGKLSSDPSYVHSVMMLANMGVLSADTGKGDLYSGPTSVDDRLALIQQVMSLDEYLDAIFFYRKVFQRVQNTDINDMSTGPDDPGYPYNQIAITNSALLTADLGFSEEEDSRFVYRLNNAAEEYLFAVVKDEMTMTYPEYLVSIDARRWDAM